MKDLYIVLYRIAKKANKTIAIKIKVHKMDGAINNIAVQIMVVYKSIVTIPRLILSFLHR